MLSNRENAFLSVARYLSTKSVARQRHGAIIVKGGRVIGAGFNKDKNNPDYISPEHVKTHSSVHAEIDAIRDAGWNVRGAVLYVARVNNHGEDRYSKPCDRCQVVIEETQIKKVIYTGSDYAN
jgi:deoxycytidylate deaminase